MLGSTIHKNFLLSLMLISLLFGFSDSIAFAKQAQYTEAERDWLSTHTTVKVAVSSDYAPISYLGDQGQHVGISAEYLQLIEKQFQTVNSSFKFQIVIPTIAQKASNDPLKKGVDMVIDFVETPERLKYWQFTQPYLKVPLHLIVRQNSQISSNLSQLNKKEIAVVDYYAAHELLARDYPNLKLILVGSNQEGLKKVAFGEVSGFVSDLPVASYWASEAGLTQLKDAGKLPYVYKISFATNRNLPELQTILEKSLAEINAETRNQIHERWIIGPFAKKPLLNDVRVWLIIACVILLLLATMWLKSRIARHDEKLIRQNKALFNLSKIINSNATNEKKFAAICQQLAEALQVARVSIWMLQDNGKLLKCTHLFHLNVGITPTDTTLSVKDYPNYFAALNANLVIAASDVYTNAATAEFASNYLPALGIGAMLDGTIWMNQKIVGVLCCEHVGGARNWTLDEQNFTSSIVDLVRLTIETDIRRKAEQALIKNNEALEQMVKTRTRSLQESEQRFASVIKYAPISIITIKMNGEIIEFNPEAEIVTGYSREQVIGKNFIELFVVKESLKKSAAIGLGAKKGQDFRGVELLLRCSDERKIEFECSIVSVSQGESKSSGQMIAIGQDITQKKALQASLIQARQAAESADRIKSMFVASMSHELRTPLNSIIGFLGVVLHGMSGDLNVKQKNQLGRAYHSSKHLLSLITDVIDISKIEAGFLQVHVEKFDLAALLVEVQHVVQHLAEEKGLTLIVECPKDIKLETDRKRLYQVVLNVVSNGLKYTEHGSVKVTASYKGKQLAVVVEDTGIGLKQADLKNLFKPFERIDSHLKIKTLGTGLGLYLTRKILNQLLGGDISVTSQSGQGSIFTIRVPVKMPEVVLQNQTSLLEDTKS